MPRIVDLSVDKIAAVDAPANRRRFLLVKSVQGARASPNSPEAKPGTDSSRAKETRMNEHVKKIDLSSFSLTEEAQEQLRKSLNEAVEAASEEAAEAAREEATQESTGEPQEPEEEVNKADLPAAVRKRLEDAEKAEERIAKLEEDRANQVFMAKAEKLPSLPLDLSERRDVLKALGQAAPEAFDKLEKALFDLQAQVDRSDLFKAVGADGQADTNPDSEIRKIAKKYREGDPNLTDEQAYVKALRENPSAYDSTIGDS